MISSYKPQDVIHNLSAGFVKIFLLILFNKECKLVEILESYS